MALVSCPKCGGVVSSTAQFCPHCGYSLNTVASGYVRCPECGTLVDDDANYCTNCGYRMITTAASILTSNILNTIFRTGYDVMLVDYNKTKYQTKINLANILDITNTQANNILNQVPCYLYTDINQDDAEYIARACQNKGMRIAVYSPAGRVQYYTPVDYNLALPSLSNIIRKALFSKPPVRKPYITHKNEQTIFHIKKDPKVNHNPAPAPHSAPKPNNGPNNHTGFNNMNNKPKNEPKPAGKPKQENRPKPDNKPKQNNKPKQEKPDNKPAGSARPDNKPGKKK